MKRHQQLTSVILRRRYFKMIIEANATAMILNETRRKGLSINRAAMGFISTNSSRSLASNVNTRSNPLTIHSMIKISNTLRARQASLSFRMVEMKHQKRLPHPPTALSRSAEPKDMIFSLRSIIYYLLFRHLIYRVLLRIFVDAPTRETRISPCTG